MNRSEEPYQLLGRQLKQMRQRMNETVAEVSGAVEIDEITLERIELGKERPSEDILLLLITHFGVQDDSAVQLWEQAGYDQSNQMIRTDEDVSAKSIMLVMSVDSRIVYSDRTQIVVTPNGVVMNFMQAPNGSFPQQIVSRIGMSHEQARSLLYTLSETLKYSPKTTQSQKRLPSPKPKNSQSPENN